MSVPPPIPLNPLTAGAAHRAIPDELTMNTDRFLRILDRLERRKQPHGDWCFVALALCLACLFPLVTTETYKQALGFSPRTWEAFMLLGAWLFGAGFIGSSVRWCYMKLKFPTKSSEDVLAEVIDQMQTEQERAGRQVEELRSERRAGPDTAPTT